MGNVKEVKRQWEMYTTADDLVTLVATAEYESDYSIAFKGEVPIIYTDDVDDLVTMLTVAKDWVNARAKEDESR